MNIYLWGTGKLGQDTFNTIQENYKEYNIKGFIDNDREKQGKKLYQKLIYSKDIINQLEDDDVILIASMYYFEIENELRESGFKRYLAVPRLINICDDKFLFSINDAKHTLYKKLQAMDIEKLNISDYNKKYLLNMKKNKWNILNTYGEMIFLLFKHFGQKFKNLSFLDYGGGTGIISLLACEVGIKNIYYNDIYDVSVNDAKVIADALLYKRKG